MTKIRNFALLPLGLIILSACTTTREQRANVQAANIDHAVAVQTARGPNPSNSTPVTINSYGYQALKRGDLNTAGQEFRQIAAEAPHDAFAELNLGAVYQSLGRMDLAEPLYRQALTHGHDLMPVDVTVDWANGLTVEQIACRNLVTGLPAATAANAKTCQTVVTIGIADTSGVVTEEFNTYFAFDSDVLTPNGLELVKAAAKRIMADPTARVVLIGRASKLGTPSHNWDLSERRSKAVATALMAAGVSADRITTNWTGETQLPVPQTQTEFQPLNRVVQGKMISGAVGTKPQR